MKNFFIVISCMVIITKTTIANAQIANVAPSLNKMEKNGFSLEGESALEWKTGNAPIFSVKGAVLGCYRHNNNHVYLLIVGRYGKTNKTLLEAAITEHLRYRYDFADWIGGELFLQHQHSEFKRLDRRMLVGAGPQFPLAIGDSFILSIGTAYMLEFEKYDSSSDESGNQYSDSGLERYYHRWSNFIGWNLKLNERVQLIHATYFQPRFEVLNDFRIMSEMSIKVQLIGRLSLKVTAIVAYNSHPAQGVERLDTYIGNSLSFSLGP